MKEAIIIGSGPAGISAALYTQRAGIKTTIISKDDGSLIKSDKIENYYGFAEPISGQQLISAGLLQAKRLDVTLLRDEVVGLAFDMNFSVQTPSNVYLADAVILATGTPRNTPKITDVDKFEGKGVSYCALCDGYFYKNKNIAVLGYSEYALAEVKELAAIVSSITLVTNGETPTAQFPDNVKIITKKIERLSGQDILESIEFSDGSNLATSGLFIAVGVAGSIDLAKKLGAVTEDKKIIVDEKMSTNIPGLYAAGDCTGGMLQISKAVYEGARAGSEVVKYLRSLK